MDNEVKIPPSFTYVDQAGRVRMADISDKGDTRRVAIARGEVHMRPETLAQIEEGRLAKGNVLTVAKIAGIGAAKRTGELIPLCHPLLLTDVDLEFELHPEKGRIDIEARVTSIGKTGVEMEALVAVSAAALTIYDMAKAVDRSMTISNICLVEKWGGKSGPFIREESREMASIRVGVLTVSDRSSQGQREDRSGPTIEEMIRARGGEVVAYRIVPDEREAIVAQLKELCDELGADLVLTTGGTGPALRDVTPEATLEVIEKRMLGFEEAMRAESLKITPHAMLSRGVSGIRGKTLIVNLPGSPKAVRENLGVILPALSHAIQILRGKINQCGDAGKTF